MSEPKYYPLLFTGEMVRANRDGRVPTPEQVEDFEQRINSALISLRNP